jgi:hypothetical protein
MADDLGDDATSLRQTASGFRHLAAQILGGDFRRRLLELALEYERRATRLERSGIERASVTADRSADAWDQAQG